MKGVDSWDNWIEAVCMNKITILDGFCHPLTYWLAPASLGVVLPCIADHRSRRACFTYFGLKEDVLINAMIEGVLNALNLNFHMLYQRYITTPSCLTRSSLNLHMEYRSTGSVFLDKNTLFRFFFTVIWGKIDSKVVLMEDFNHWLL